MHQQQTTHFPRKYYQLSCELSIKRLEIRKKIPHASSTDIVQHNRTLLLGQTPTSSWALHHQHNFILHRNMVGQLKRIVCSVNFPCSLLGSIAYESAILEQYNSHSMSFSSSSSSIIYFKGGNQLGKRERLPLVQACVL